MKKVLIVCDVFPPAFAPRMGYLVKYLGDFGWDADVLCIDSLKDNNFQSLVGNNRIIRVTIDKLEVPPSISGKIYRMLSYRSRFINNKNPFIKGAEELLKKGDYNLVLVSTAWNLFILYAGAEIAKTRNVPFIADLRDIYEQKGTLYEKKQGLKGILINQMNKGFYKKNTQLRNQSLKETAAITSVSPYHMKVLSAFNSNTHLIYNGFDPELFYPKNPLKQKKFLITYTGILTDIETRDPTILFKTINKLKQEGVISKDFFRVQFYMPERTRGKLKELPGFVQVQEYFDFFDYVEFSEVPNVLRNSSILLLVTNKESNKGPRGIMTTKFFEYLGVERPILCVRSDESFLEEAIKKANAGVAARNEEQAYDFLKEELEEWKQKGCTTVNVNRKYTKQFSRKLQAKQFVEVFEKVIES